MIDEQKIDDLFLKALKRHGAAKELGISVTYKSSLLYKQKNGQRISLDVKVKILKRAGLLPDGVFFSRADVISIINFTIRTSQAARDFGAAYVLEKWQSTL